MLSSENTAYKMRNYFKTRGYVPGGVITNSKSENFDIQAMPPFLRTLLVTDGTVTKSLEAFFWESVSVENLGQEVVRLDRDVEWLEMNAGEEALERQIKLTGDDTGDIYAYAKSVLKLGLLPEPVRAELLDGKIGIGEMLRERGMETYREIVDIGREIDESLQWVFGVGRCGELVYRTYRVLMGQKPVIQITEKFPYRLYARKRQVWD